MNGNDPQFLQPTLYIQSTAPQIIARASQITKGCKSNAEKAVALFNAVRDDIRYDPYTISLTEQDYLATNVLERPANWCVPKAILLTALTRAAKIPAAIGFADVRNHLTTEKLQALMQSDLFTYHGYTAFWLENHWVKATPAFNMDMCTRFGVQPLVFDGKTDTLFHEYDTSGQRHMEYVNDRGLYTEAPIAEIINDMITRYPNFKKAIESGSLKSGFHDKKFQHGQQG